MGNGPSTRIIHVGSIAAGSGMRTASRDLATEVEAIVDRGGWPPRAAAYARYNLACFHALAGRLDEARALLRVALPGRAGRCASSHRRTRSRRPPRRDPGARARLTEAQATSLPRVRCAMIGR